MGLILVVQGAACSLLTHLFPIEDRNPDWRGAGRGDVINDGSG